MTPAVTPTAAGHPTFSGVWLSRYEYVSSGRSATFTGQHYVVILQHGNRLTVRRVAGAVQPPPLSIDAGP